MSLMYVGKIGTRRKPLLSLGLAALVLVHFSNAARSQTSPPIPPEASTNIEKSFGVGKARIYTHSQLGYTLAILPGTDVFERQDDKTQITIRSRKGYKITVQAGKSHHHMPLKQLPKAIEHNYFGKGKPWHKRLQEQAIQVAGLSAYEINYEGENNRTQVVFVRGRKYDYVFIFFAGRREFPLYIHEFEWLLKNFSPAEDENIPKQEQFQARATKFSEPGYGYSMLFPSDWMRTGADNMTMMFSGRAGTPAYTSIISIQNVQPPGAKNSGDALKRAVADLKANLHRSVPGVEFPVDQPWVYQRGKVQLHGRELNAIYMHAGQRFRKIMFVIARPVQPIAHIWSYTAPDEDFQDFQPLAEQVLNSWTITDVGSQ